MRLLVFLGATAAMGLVGCLQSQDLGSPSEGGAKGDGESDAAAPPADANEDASDSANATDSAKAADTGTKTDASDASTPKETGGSDTSPPKDGGGGSDATTSTACTTPPGYPSAVGLYATITGGTLAATYDIPMAVTALYDSSWGAPFANHYGVEATFPPPDSLTSDQFHMYLPTVTAPTMPTVGTSYPLTAEFVHFVTPSTLASDSKGEYFYPPSMTGPGSCTIVFDQLINSGLVSCSRARFSCTGLVGETTGASIDVSNGYVVFGASGSGPDSGGP